MSRFSATVIFVLVGAAGFTFIPVQSIGKTLEELCDDFRAQQISGTVLCAGVGFLEQQSCDKHCQGAHNATYGECSADPGTTAPYCHCHYTSAPAGHVPCEPTDLICLGWNQVAVTVLCATKAVNLDLVSLGYTGAQPLCALDCACIHKLKTGNYGTCTAPALSPGKQYCKCNQ